MKIDTSKLTPVQAQQIEAIASGIAFTLSSHSHTVTRRQPISIRMTATDDTDYYDKLIALYISSCLNACECV